MKKFQEITNIKEIRKQTKLSQSDFWGVVGVTQSGGSRYESGRSIPKAVRELIRIVYIEKIDLKKVNADDLIVGGMLKKVDKVRYKEMKKAATSQ